MHDKNLPRLYLSILSINRSTWCLTERFIKENFFILHIVQIFDNLNVTKIFVQYEKKRAFVQPILFCSRISFTDYCMLGTRCVCGSRYADTYCHTSYIGVLSLNRIMDSVATQSRTNRNIQHRLCARDLYKRYNTRRIKA